MNKLIKEGIAAAFVKAIDGWDEMDTMVLGLYIKPEYLKSSVLRKTGADFLELDFVKAVWTLYKGAQCEIVMTGKMHTVIAVDEPEAPDA